MFFQKRASRIHSSHNNLDCIRLKNQEQPHYNNTFYLYHKIYMFFSTSRSMHIRFIFNMPISFQPSLRMSIAHKISLRFFVDFRISF